MNFCIKFVLFLLFSNFTSFTLFSIIVSHILSLLKKIRGKMLTHFSNNFSLIFFDRMGCQRPESGSIKVFGYDPKTPESGVPGPGVGFMPQEVSLHNDLTILEMISYFGRLFFIPKKQLEDEIDTIMTVLQLPPRNRLIGTLSGGQKRR